MKGPRHGTASEPGHRHIARELRQGQTRAAASAGRLRDLDKTTDRGLVASTFGTPLALFYPPPRFFVARPLAVTIAQRRRVTRLLFASTRGGERRVHEAADCTSHGSQSTEATILHAKSISPLDSGRGREALHNNCIVVRALLKYLIATVLKSHHTTKLHGTAQLQRYHQSSHLKNGATLSLAMSRLRAGSWLTFRMKT